MLPAIRRRAPLCRQRLPAAHVPPCGNRIRIVVPRSSGHTAGARASTSSARSRRALGTVPYPATQEMNLPRVTASPCHQPCCTGPPVPSRQPDPRLRIAYAPVLAALQAGAAGVVALPTGPLTRRSGLCSRRSARRTRHMAWPALIACPTSSCPQRHAAERGEQASEDHSKGLIVFQNAYIHRNLTSHQTFGKGPAGTTNTPIGTLKPAIRYARHDRYGGR